MQTDSGYTLVELLMATAVGAVVVAAAYASYAVVSGYYEKLSDMANLQDTGRQSLYMMVRDIRMAGYEHYAYNKATKTYESEYGSVSESIKIKQGLLKIPMQILFCCYCVLMFLDYC